MDDGENSDAAFRDSVGHDAGCAEDDEFPGSATTTGTTFFWKLGEAGGGAKDNGELAIGSRDAGLREVGVQMVQVVHGR